MKQLAFLLAAVLVAASALGQTISGPAAIAINEQATYTTATARPTGACE